MEIVIRELVHRLVLPESGELQVVHQPDTHELVMSAPGEETIEIQRGAESVSLSIRRMTFRFSEDLVRRLYQILEQEGH